MSERFNQYACCKKCGAGYTSIGIKHVTFGHRPDAIRRTCGRCGFTWDEAPLDAHRAASVGGGGQ